MDRDLIVQQVVAIDAQLRRMRRLAESITDPAELRARLPRLLAETARTSHALLSRIGQAEGWQAGQGGPRSD